MIAPKKLKTILEKIPPAPGVYKMIGKEDTVQYIGKAKDLRKRVKQYFQKSKNLPIRTAKLLENTENINFTTVDSELEAMILETNLIKELKPKYNILMKDDKNYVYIKITREDFPRIQIVRKIEKDKAKYIGPKTAAHKVKETFKLLKKIFPFRHCGLNIKIDSTQKNNVKVTHKTIKYPCLDYYIKRCAAPCIGKCTKEQYHQIIQNVENFLEGKADKILNDLYKNMQELAQNREFEKAAKLRDKIEKVKNILEKQKVSDPNQEDKDIINYLVTHNRAYFNLFQIRDGKLIGQENFILSAKDIEENSEENEILEAFLNQYYEIATDIPKEILIPHNIENKKEIEFFLDQNSRYKTKLVIPQKGTKNKLLNMSLKNARIFADRNKPSWYTESEYSKNALKDLQNSIKISSPLNRIECYDISHISGKETVGSMIVFINGVPEKSMYRKFKLKTIKNKPDDYKSLEEVLKRRFQKISQNIKQKDFVYKKARKKDQEFIEKHNNVDFKKKDREFFILEKKSSPVGFIALLKHSEKINELTNLWIDKKYRGKKLGYKLLRNTIKKAKPKRIYGICKYELREYYFLMGFEEVKKIPIELEKRFKEKKKKLKNPLCIVYDKNKHKPDKSFSQIPNLVIIDGGKGQLSITTKVFKELKFDIPYISISKKLEEIHIPNKKQPIILDKNNEALKLIQRARNEAHRFAISYNKNLREKNFFS